MTKRHGTELRLVGSKLGKPHQRHLGKTDEQVLEGMTSPGSLSVLTGRQHPWMAHAPNDSSVGS